MFRVARSIRLLLLSAVLAVAALAQSSTAAKKELTLEDIFAGPGLTGPSPSQLRWNPDGRRLTYILPQADGEKRDLWEVNPETGEKRILRPAGLPREDALHARRSRQAASVSSDRTVLGRTPVASARGTFCVAGVPARRSDLWSLFHSLSRRNVGVDADAAWPEAHATILEPRYILN